MNESIRIQILQAIKGGASFPWELAETTNQEPHTVQHYLKEMVASGDLVRVRRGVYAITSQGKAKLPKPVVKRAWERVSEAIVGWMR